MSVAKRDDVAVNAEMIRAVKTIRQFQFGDRIGAYIVNGFAGRGASSYVYRARRVDGFKPAAIKVLHSYLVSDPAKRRQFYREARIMMRMQHRNIVQFYEIIEEDGVLAFVMEYIDGVTLDTWRGQTDYDLNMLAHVFADILRGLGCAHRQHIVHRDLKPANILISYENGRYIAKIIDFGVARLSEEPLSDRELKKIVGTAAYISPEEINDPHTICAGSDIYSLGVMLYEAACGCRPFNNMTVQELLNAHINVPPVAPRAINPQLPIVFESVVLKSLEKHITARYQCVFSMLEDIEEAIHHIQSSLNPVNESAVPPRSSSYHNDSAPQCTLDWKRDIDSTLAPPSGLSGLARKCAKTLLSLSTVGPSNDRCHFLNRDTDLRLPF